LESNFLCQFMKEKIYHFLEAKEGGASTQELIQRFFCVPGSYPSRFESILSSLLGDDPRFVRDEQGNWRVNPKLDRDDLARRIFSIIDIEACSLSKGQEIPVAIGIIRLKNEQLLTRQIFTVPFRDKLSAQLERRVAALKAQFPRSLPLDQHIEAIFQHLDHTIIVSDSPAKDLAALNDWFRSYLGNELEAERLSLIDLARLLIPGSKIRTLQDIADSLSLIYSDPMDLNARLDLMSTLTIQFINELKRQSLQSWSDVKRFIERTKIWVDFSRFQFDQDFIKTLPETPGVYVMKDRSGVIFYVGKAKNLRARVESYFVNRFELDGKGRTILDRITELSYEQVGSELEALLLENHYINQYRPELNIQINVHPTNLSAWRRRRLILFLPGLSEREVVLFLVAGTEKLIRVKIDRDVPNWSALVELLAKLLDDWPGLTSEYTQDQIEIFWRWFNINQHQVNFIDLDNCGTYEECLELAKHYCADPRLFLEKMLYR